ncbi:MAG: hypothetical protein ABI699_05990 [Caldimonas sp.]
MPRISLQVAFGAAVLLTSPFATALGFAAGTTYTSLGQPLDFGATLLLDADETVSRDCVFAEVHSGDTRVPPRQVRVVLEASSGTAQRIVRVTTATVIDEPIVTIEVSVGCGSRVSRRFVSFVDPPVLRLAETIVPDSTPVQGAGLESQTALLADIARQADASRRGGAGPSTAGPTERVARSARRVPRSASLVVARAPAAVPARAQARRQASTRNRPAVARTALAAPPRTGGARLRLDPPRVMAALPPTAASAAASAAAPAILTAPPPAAASVTLPEAVLAVAQAATLPPASASDAASQERIRTLELDLARARVDSQKSNAAWQAKLRQAEGGRYGNWLVYLLIGTTGLGVLAALALWWLRPRQRRRARWFEEQASQARAARIAQRQGAGAASSPSSLPAPAPSEPASLWRESASSVLSATRPASIGGLEVTTVLGPELSRPVFEPSIGAAGQARKGGELSMEELIDLEQQAEFFVVLGQDEAAIDLLDAYMQGTGGKSPLPYLRLLEVHQRRGDQAAYDQVRKSFNERFSALAPDWRSDLQLGRSLEDYPQAVARLQSLWATPLSAMQALDNLLFRRQSADQTFDFPAYRELLFLYSIARELSGNVETDFGSIDLFLPLEGAPLDTSYDAHETDEEDEQGQTGAGALTVDLDVTNWPEDATMSDLLVRRAPARRGKA